MENKIEIISEVSKLKGKPIIQAFSGSGAIGTILSTYLTQVLNMDEVALIHTDAIPPVAIVKDGKIMHPIRIFASEQISLMSCEVPIPYSQLSNLLEMLVEFYIKNEVSYIVPVGGLPVLYNPEEKAQCYAISYNDNVLQYIQEKEIQLLREGVVYGSIIETLEICQTKELSNCFSLLAECDPGAPSYYSTRRILESLAKIFDFEFDVKEFEAIVKLLKERMLETSRYLEILDEEIAKKTRESHL
ncbi:MAG: proteasome assembly chaperone family protein [Candidatus Heimdallarchaeaceae archaeon]